MDAGCVPVRLRELLPRGGTEGRDKTRAMGVSWNAQKMLPLALWLCLKGRGGKGRGGEAAMAAGEEKQRETSVENSV